MHYSNPLEQFFAVTNTSVYRVCAARDSRGQPTVQKIFHFQNTPFGVGTHLVGGTFVAITRFGISLYGQQNHIACRPLPEETDPRTWGGGTSPVLALFLEEDDAIRCAENLKKGNCEDAQLADVTKQVLDAIGQHHPVFVIPRTHRLRL